MDRNKSEQSWESQASYYPVEENDIPSENVGDGKGGGFKSGLFLGMALTLAVALAVVGTLFGTGVVQVAGRTEVTNNVMTDAVMQKLNNLIGEIGRYYYEDVNTEDLVTGIYKGLFEGLGDPYSEYYTKQEYEDIMIDANANYYGIGAALLQDKNTMQVTISKVYDGSGAQTAGLMEGDEIIQVEDIVSVSVELADLVQNIRGEEGTTVHITVLREGETEYREFDVKRGEINIPTVESKLLEGDVGYIQVLEFATSTSKDFVKEIESLSAQGMKYMIVDLRGNGGGVLTACQEMLDAVLPEGVVVYTEDKNGVRVDYTSDAEHFMDIPMAVLIDGHTASASEIFAGAIRDYDYGTLIGTKTFGKGIVQSVRSLPDGSAYKMTVSKYFTPNGDNIHGTGIEPDIELEYEYTGDEDEEYDELKDNQIQKAIEVLRGEAE
jgi:carboxyl-terminal processing protease